MKHLLIFLALLSTLMVLPISTSAECEDGSSVEECMEDGGESPEESTEEDSTSENEGTNLGTEEDENEQAIADSNQSLFLDFVKMIAALALVLGLIYFLLKFLQKRNRLYQQSKSLENLGGIALGSNKSVQVVRIGNQYFVVGVGDNVNLLTPIDDPETIDELTKEQPPSPGSSSFQSLLKSLQNRQKNPYQEQETNRQFKMELQSMKNARDRVMKRNRNRDEDSDV
ncbi:flagellar biosynthetic protein FliO [Halalkalibacillus sediminis]|nr:flagellar biosynthetic protein FliO [Halalkalibacillus sediminis]